MTNSTKTNFFRKVAIALGAIAISTMTLAGAADAKPKFTLQLNLGGGSQWNGHGGVGHVHGGHGGHGFVATWSGPSCSYYWSKYQKTGKWYWQNLYYQCASASH